MLIFVLRLLPLTVLGQNLDGQTAVYEGAFANPVQAPCTLCVESISTREQPPAKWQHCIQINEKSCKFPTLASPSPMSLPYQTLLGCLECFLSRMPLLWHVL